MSKFLRQRGGLSPDCKVFMEILRVEDDATLGYGTHCVGQLARRASRLHSLCLLPGVTFVRIHFGVMGMVYQSVICLLRPPKPRRWLMYSCRSARW